MDIKKVQRQWATYCAECENNEEIDFEMHLQMASKVGCLLRIIGEKQKEIENLKEYLGEIKEENQWLYGKLNQISGVIDKARSESR